MLLDVLVNQCDFDLCVVRTKPFCFSLKLVHPSSRLAKMNTGGPLLHVMFPTSLCL